MRPERVLKKLKGLKGRDHVLHAVGDDIGNELPRGRLDVLRQVLTDLARLQGTDSGFTDDPFVNGYVFALRDVLHATITVLDEEQDIDEAARTLLEHGFRPLLNEIFIPGAVDLDRLVQVVHLPVEIVRPKLDLLIAADLVGSQAPGKGTPELFRLTARGDKVRKRMDALRSDP